MSFGVDVLGTLTEKLRQMVNETQGQYSNFAIVNNMYKEGQINERDFFDNVSTYIINVSALNFLAVRVLIELKSTIDKGTSIKDATGGGVSTSVPAGPQGNFGIGAFVGAGSLPRKEGSVDTVDSKLSLPQAPTFKRVDIDLRTKHQPNEQENKTISEHGSRSCSICGATTSKQAKFCRSCGSPIQKGL
jgi:hypothetical protein